MRTISFLAISTFLLHSVAAVTPAFRPGEDNYDNKATVTNGTPIEAGESVINY